MSMHCVFYAFHIVYVSIIYRLSNKDWLRV